MDIDITTITLAALLTTAGSTAAAALLTGLVSVLTTLAPGQLDGHQKQLAAGLAAVLVLLLAVQAVATASITVGVPLLLAVVFGWYAVTRLSMAIYDDLKGKPASLRGSSAGDPPAPYQPPADVRRPS